MKIKKYTVSNMQEAMSEIKNDLGPDAVIISSEKAPRKSLKDFFIPRKMVVTAAVEENKNQELPGSGEVNTGNLSGEDTQEGGKRIPAAVAVERTQTNKNSGNGIYSGGSNSNKPVISKDLTPSKLPQPLLNMGQQKEDKWFKSTVDDMITRQEGLDVSNPVNKIREMLREIEIHDHIVDTLVAEMGNSAGDGTSPENKEEFLQVSLKNNIVRLVSSVYKNGSDNKIITFVGPTGVGKTTSLVKMATRYKVFHEKSIALIALYDHRFGSLEELNYYAEIIGAPVEIVMTPGELDKAIQKHEDKDYIFIDTEGRPSKNTAQVLELKTFIDAVGDRQDILLVLSATTKNRDLMRIARDFSRVGFTGMVFTKLDETDTFGSMLNVICEVGAPVSYITNGQNIPDDIEKVSAKRIANLITEGLDQSERVEF